MDASPSLAPAGVQPGDTTIMRRAIARFAAAHKLFFVGRTLEELRATPGVDVQLVKHYETEHARLSRELGLGAIA